MLLATGKEMVEDQSHYFFAKNEVVFHPNSVAGSGIVQQVSAEGRERCLGLMR